MVYKKNLLRVEDKYQPLIMQAVTEEEKKILGEPVEYIEGDHITICERGWKNHFQTMLEKPLGRPIILYEELAESVREYAINFEKHGDIAPTNIGLAVYLGITERSLYNILNKIPDTEKSIFFQSIGLIRQHGKHSLIQKALKGEIKENMTKFILNVDFGMVERKETNLNVTGTVNITDALKGIDKPKAIDAEIVDDLKF